jgi:glycosyltransferase involved in cell wall biosynthesis
MRDYSREMQSRIREMASRYDLLVADSLYMAPYVADLPVPKILQQHNVESYLVAEFLSRQAGVTSWIGRLELRHLEAFERDRCNAFDAVVTLSEVDRRRLEALGVRAPITVAPPAVDPVEAVPDGPNRRNVVYLGTQHWPPIADGLRWYLNEVHGRLAPHLGAAQVVLAGPQPPRDVREEAERRGVRVLGYVDNTEPVYRNTAVFMVPLRIGGGVRLKILHALARGLAVVSTTPGCEGLDLVPERHLLIADDPDAFASAIVRVLRDPDLRRRLGAEGRAYVLEHFSQTRRWATFAALAAQVTAKRPALQAEPPVAAGRVL